MKGLFWMIVFLSLTGFQAHLLGIFLILGIGGIVVKMFFAPFKI